MILRLFSDGKFDKNTKNSQVLFIFQHDFQVVCNVTFRWWLHCIYTLEETECNSAYRLEEIELLFFVRFFIGFDYIFARLLKIQIRKVISVLLISFGAGYRFIDKFSVEIDFRLAKNYSQ